MTRLIAIDIGNSNTKVGCFQDSQLIEVERFTTERNSGEQLEDGFDDLLALLSQANAVDGLIVSSVVPEAHPWLKQLPSSLHSKTLFLERRLYGALNLGTLNLSHYQTGALGTDRLANMVAAQDQYPNQHVITCDFGTTATFNLVDPEGLFIGGAIAPGARKFQSLMATQHASQLFEVDLFCKPKQTPALTTEQSIANGLYYGYKGAVLEILGNLLQQAGWPVSHTTFVFTGGDAQTVQEMVSFEIPQIHINPTLTLMGLHTLWMMQQDAGLSSVQLAKPST